MSKASVNDALGIDPVQIGRRSDVVAEATGIGVDVVADHRNAVGIGRDAQALGNDATAIGTETRAPSQWNTVIGYQAGSQQNGVNVVAIGRKAEVQGDNSAAVGETARANASDTVAVGRDAAALEADATALGRDATASASSAIAVGQGTTATVPNSVEIGPRDYAIDDGRGLLYPAGTGPQTLVSKPVDGSFNAGDPVGYSLGVGGTTIATIFAESDGAGGIRNPRLDVPVSLSVAGETTEVDNVVTGRFAVEDGSQVTQFLFDATGGTVSADFGGNTVTNVGDLSFDPVTGSPTFTGHDHSEGGLTNVPNAGLANDSITVSAGTGLTSGGTVALGGSTTLDHANTTSEGDLTAGAGAAIDSVSLDQFGHVTGLGTKSFDGRYVTESGDTMSGALTVNNNVTANRVDVNGVGGTASTDGSKGIGAPSVYTNIVEAQSEKGGLSTYIQLSSGGPKSINQDEVAVITDGAVQTLFDGGNIETSGELTEGAAL